MVELRRRVLRSSECSRSRLLGVCGLGLGGLGLVGIGLCVALGSARAAEATGAQVTGAMADPFSGVEGLLSAIDGEERAIKRRLRSTATEHERARLRVLARGRAYVRMKRAGLLPMSDGFDALVEHATRLERLERAIEQDLSILRSLLAERKDLNARLVQLRARRGPLEAQQSAMAQAKSVLESARDRALAFQQAFESSGTDHTAIYGAGVGPQDALGGATGFEQLKGRLPFPVTGRAEVQTASRQATDGRGLEMRAAPGAPVRAVFAGRVAFADEYADYGLTVIVDHGDQYFTVLANLGKLEVRAGDELSAGARLGTLPKSADASLYFEIRKGSKTLPPREWFGL